MSQNKDVMIMAGTRKVLVGLGAVLVALAAFFAGAKEVKASDFDPAFYAAQYPDVVAAYGTDPNALYSHYLSFGKNEKRFKNAHEAASGVIEETPEQTTFVDVNLSGQSLVYYVEGQPVLTTSIVSGNESDGHNTPTGVFFIDTKVPGKYLVGPTWNVWVDRWMKFTGTVGIHDATWRSKFGGEIYKTNGSHGCVNIPHDVALKLYDMVDIGTMVVVH